MTFDEVLVWLGVGAVLGALVGVAIVVCEGRLRARLPLVVLAGGATLALLGTGYCVYVTATDRNPESMNAVGFVLWLFMLAILAIIGTFQTLKGGARWWTNTAGLLLQIGVAALLIYVAASINNFFYGRALAANPSGAGYSDRVTQLVHAFGSGAGNCLIITLLVSAFAPTLWRILSGMPAERAALEPRQGAKRDAPDA